MPHLETTPSLLKQLTNSDNPLKDKSPSPLPKDKVLQEELTELPMELLMEELQEVLQEEMEVLQEELQEELQEVLLSQQVELPSQLVELVELQDLFQEEPLILLVFQTLSLLTQVLLNQSQNLITEQQEDSQLEISQLELIQLYLTTLPNKLLIVKHNQLKVIEDQSLLMMLL